MMCPSRINTDTIMANLFSATKYPGAYTVEDIKNYFLYLRNSWPCYLDSDFSEQEVLSCVRRYPELYVTETKSDGSMWIMSGDMVPNLKLFNSWFSQNAANYIEGISSDYILALNSKVIQ